MPEFSRMSLIDGFDVPDLSSKQLVDIVKKSGKSRSSKKRSDIESMPLDERLKYIKSEVHKILGRYRGFVRVIRDEKELSDYIDRAIEVNYLSFDTETNNSLDPLTCKLMGLCLYIPNTKPVYVPMNHTKPGTDTLLENQISEEFVRKMFIRLKESGTKMVYHNGKFDIRVCYNTTGVYLPIWWDTMIASQLLDENVPAKLKYQFKLRVDPTIDSYNIEKLFTGLPYAWIDPDVFALYAAIDAYDTYKLQKNQQHMFEQEGMERLYKLFLDIEVPVVLVTSHMEDDGICLDLDFLKRLNSKYESKKEECLNRLIQLSSPYNAKIKELQEKGVLDNPVNYDSNDQLKVILYDLMKTPIVEEFGKSTEKDALKAIGTEFTDAILDYRHYSKLISGFTEPLPGWLSTRDNKLHASFNQMGKEDKGVRTGRFSSTDPKQDWGFVA